MAAIHTFDWMIQQMSHQLSAEAKKFADTARAELQKMRNEEQRYRYIDEIQKHLRELRQKKS